MNLTQITKKFSQGIKWNAFFYTFRKSLSTIFTIILFKKLSTQNFAIWANINSLIFLSILWLDFGFRKSLPRFCPIFAKNKSSMKKFIQYIVLFQSMVLAITGSIFLILANTIAMKLNIKINLLYLGCFLFFLEGIISVMRLIYHSYFWQKQFNSLMSVIITMKISLLMLLILFNYKNTKLLKIIFTTEIIAGSIAIPVLLFMLKYLYKDKNYPGKQKINFTKTGKAFVVHSGVMWTKNNLKSLSERNFMMLALTHTLGPSQANLFKIANDSALLFQRIVKKTIETTDTSLLSHIQTLPEHKKLIPIAFTRLMNRIASFCIPLLALFFIFILHFGYLFQDEFIYKAFVLITIFYLTEAMISPYERLLEVKRKYLTLGLSYLPYILVIILFIVSNTINYLGLLKTLIIIHTGRLASILLIVFYIRYKYKIKFPFRKISKIVLFITPIIILVLAALKIFF